MGDSVTSALVTSQHWQLQQSTHYISNSCSSSSEIIANTLFVIFNLFCTNPRYVNILEIIQSFTGTVKHLNAPFGDLDCGTLVL